MVENEIWKNVHIEEYTDYYMVSNLGRVKSIKKTIAKILNSSPKSGYFAVYLENNIIKDTMCS